MERYALVLLRTPAGAPAYPAEELERIQRAHLDHLAGMHERGAMVVAGPFADQQDQTLRGMCLYRVDLEEARALAAADPAVRAGRLAVDAFWWYVPKGYLARE